MFGRIQTSQTGGIELSWMCVIIKSYQFALEYLACEHWPNSLDKFTESLVGMLLTCLEVYRSVDSIFLVDPRFTICELNFQKPFWPIA